MEDAGKFLSYVACTLSVAFAVTTGGLIMAVLGCVRLAFVMP